MTHQKTILVAPLHWGLGHATRCIPIIKKLIECNFKVLLASDGNALQLLRQELPGLEYIVLPSYNVSYSKKASLFKLKLLLNLPHIQKTIGAEKKIINELVAAGRIHGIISDNRLGVRSKKVPSVFITHQLHVLSGKTSWLSSRAHQTIIKKFSECWVPDIKGQGNLSGTLGHLKNPDFPVKYIGPLSRMRAENLPKRYDVLCLLSGPEPQRGLLESKIRKVFLGSSLKILLVQGIVENTQQKSNLGNIEIINYLKTKELEQAINESEFVLSRSGYTTIMDLAVMGKKAFFVPTPGQYEQAYLAKRLKSKGIIPSCRQEDLSLDQLSEVNTYPGFEGFQSRNDLEGLFGLFEGK